jgi:3-oxoadipate CoA-transferase alpha subunit
MINKQVASVAEALEGTKDGSVILVGGFGAVGLPMALIEGLAEIGARDLTIVSNNPGFGTTGLARLMKLGLVRKVICSFPRTSKVFSELFAEGKLELEINPQGTLAERLRAAGAGIGGFYTNTSASTVLEKGKEVREIDGERYVFEKPLYGDVALIEGWEADRWGNLSYKGAGCNFNHVMAMAGKKTIAQVQRVTELGEIDALSVATQGIFVDQVVTVPYDPPFPAISYE